MLLLQAIAATTNVDSEQRQESDIKAGDDAEVAAISAIRDRLKSGRKTKILQDRQVHQSDCFPAGSDHGNWKSGCRCQDR